MTRKEFDGLRIGQMVWIAYKVLRFPMVGIIRKEDGRSVVYVNFFGDAQTTFDYRGMEKDVTLYEIDMTRNEG